MIPSVEDLRSDPLVHRFGDVFSPPALTNFLGAVQSDFDIAAIRSLNFPPFGSGDVITGSLFLNNRLFVATGAPITYTWYPDRIVREAEWEGLSIRTTTVMARATMAVLVRLEITNRAPERDLDVRLALRAGVTKRTDQWGEPEPPAEEGHAAAVDPSSRAVTFTSRAGDAVCVQAASPVPPEADPYAFRWRSRIDAGQTWRADLVVAVGDDQASVLPKALRLLADATEEIDAVRDEWNAELAAMFTPGNGRYSGSLPELDTEDLDVARLYWLGALGVTYFKRDTPYSMMGRTYDTLMPRYWPSVTFLWDYSLSSLVHGMLDPGVMRHHLQYWMTTDIHTCFGTDWLTGKPVGGWYSVNDHAMTKLMAEYLRWSGDWRWLDEVIPMNGDGPTPVGRLMERYATNWERFRTDNGLADYGGIGNLLECVSTYVHEVAGMNAANVFNLRATAEVIAACAAPARAERYRAQADALVAEINKLYAPGEGHWNTRFPDGRLVPVKHCYDFITVLANMAGDLSPTQKREMTSFFVSELQTPTWMRALSSGDPDAIFSVRPDHQWTGAYPAWPPQAVQGLYRMGEVDLAFSWLKGLARSANQGPFGQAHFAENVVAPDAGGARKAPPDLPYITDWACSSNGSWCNIVIESIFGLHAPMDRDELAATPAFGPFDPGARLRNIPFRGRLYDADASGVRPVS